MASILEKLRTKLDAKRSTAVGSFWDIVRLIGTGKDPDPDRVAAALDAAGRTLDDLAAAVAVYERRLELSAVFKRGPEAAREMAKVDAAIAAEDRKLDAARRAYEEATSPLRDRRATLQAEADAADRAAEDLPSSCPYPDVRAALADALRDREEAVTAAAKLRQRIQDLKADIAGTEARAAEAVGRSMTLVKNTGDFDASMTAKRTKLADFEKLLGQAEAHGAAVEKRLAELERKACEP